VRFGAWGNFLFLNSLSQQNWALSLVWSKRFRRLNAPELLPEVYLGVKFLDGLPEKQEKMGVAA
jgi:hypothetical protein